MSNKEQKYQLGTNWIIRSYAANSCMSASFLVVRSWQPSHNFAHCVSINDKKKNKLSLANDRTRFIILYKSTIAIKRLCYIVCQQTN